MDVNIDDIVIVETKQFTYEYPQKILSATTENEMTGIQITETSIDLEKPNITANENKKLTKEQIPKKQKKTKTKTKFKEGKLVAPTR